MHEKHENANCEILNENVVVARQVDSVFEIVCPDLLPLYLKRLHSVDSWLKTRAIDKHRTNSRLIKRARRLSNENDLETVWKVNAATITDRFWIRPLQSELNYEDIRFKENYFAELALHGTSFAECSESPLDTPTAKAMGFSIQRPLPSKRRSYTVSTSLYSGMPRPILNEVNPQKKD